jgi:hypothetical protein
VKGPAWQLTNAGGALWAPEGRVRPRCSSSDVGARLLELTLRQLALELSCT